MFITKLREFDHQPLIEVAGGNHRIVRGKAVLQGEVVWFDVETETEIVVPDRFVTDLASLPWWVGFLLKKLGSHQRAAVLHDWLYQNRLGTKEWADRQFKRAMEYDNVETWRINLIMAGLKAGGWVSWNKDSVVHIAEVLV